MNPGDIYLNIEAPFEISVSEDTPNGEYEFELLISSNNTEYAIYESQSIITLNVNNSLSIVEDQLPDSFKISNPFPNPFNPSTQLSWSMSQPSNVLIEVYNLNGELLNVIVDAYYTSGDYNLFWDAASFSTGVYLIRYSFNDSIHTQKITILK